jgi:predicted ferric reductase
MLGRMARSTIELDRPSSRATAAAPRFGSADLLGPLALGTVVVAAFFWLRNEGLASLTTVDSGLRSLGLLTGLLASDLLLLQCVMLARIPWVERAWGHDVLARRHKWIGFASFWLMMAHVLLLAAQRIERRGGWQNAEMWKLFIGEPWLLAATVGTVMIIVVVVTSVRAARRSLRYESWHLLHLYAYVGVALALPHQIAVGMDFQSAYATFPQLYWWALYAAGAGAIVAFRLALPIGRSLYHQARVDSVVRESPGVVSVRVTGHRLDRLRTKSGQFFIWRFLDGPGWSRANPYTISAAPTDNQLRVTIQARGDGSARADRLRPGTRVFLEGPYGSMTADRRQHARLLLMAAGVGITPIRALLEDTPYGPGEAMLIYRVSTAADAILADEIDRIAARRDVAVRYLAGPRRADGSWLPAGTDLPVDDSAALLQIVPDVAQRDLFVCGPPAWMAAVRRAARTAGVRTDQIHTEDFGW